MDFGSAWKALVEETNKLTVSGTCEACPNNRLCNTCAALAMAETGSTNGTPTYLCKAVKVLEEISKIQIK
jgi:hypothetical protein